MSQVMEDRAAKIEQLRLESWFPNAQDDIVRPDQVLPVTLYFLQHWAPRLGPDAVQLLLWIRAEFARRGSRDPNARFVELPAQRELAVATGLGGEKSVRAALRRLEAVGFLHRESRHRFDRSLGRTVRDPDRYLVGLADPVAPEHEDELLAVQAARAAAQAAQCSIFTASDDGDGRDRDTTPESEAAQRAVSVECNGPTGRHSGGEAALRAVSVGVPALRAVSVRSAPDNDIGESGSEAAQRAGMNVRSNGTDNVDSIVPTEEIARRAAESDARARQQNLVEDLVAGLGDGKSRRWFTLIAARLPEETVRIALAEALDARRQGRIRKGSGAMFTSLVKRAASEMGVSLERARRGAAA